MSSRKILVTGGAGFIGSNLCIALAARGEQVVALDNLSVSESNLPILKEHGVEFVKADIADYEEMEKHFKGVDIVYHVAAMNRAQRSIEDPRAANAANITGTLNVLEAMRKHSVTRIIFVSSSSVYAGREAALKEDAPVAPPHPYGVGKLAGEHYVRIYGDLFDVRWTTLRFFSVYGPHQLGNIDKAGVIAKFIYQAFNGKPLSVYGDGSSLRNFTYVGDVVRCLLLALDKPQAQGNIINVANAREVSVNEIADAVQRITGKNVGVVHEPALKGDPPRNLPDTNKAKQLLGYEAEVSIEEGVAKTVAWYLSTQA
jgi:UDP-glucose 4-epimerase